MTIAETDKIDMMAVSKDGKSLSLVIADHLPWDDGEATKQHLGLLQDKINTYYAYLGSKEILKAHPQARTLKIRLEVSFRHEPNETAREFLDYVTTEIAKDGYTFHYAVAEN